VASVRGSHCNVIICSNDGYPFGQPLILDDRRVQSLVSTHGLSELHQDMASKILRSKRNLEIASVLDGALDAVDLDAVDFDRVRAEKVW
jgi:hypothetical protein